MILQNKQASIGQALLDLAGMIKRTLLFNVTFLVATASVFVLMTLPNFWLMMHVDSMSPNILVALRSGTVFLASSVVAWIMTPAAIRLLRTSESGAVSSQAKKYGRYTAIAVEAAIVALSIIIPKLLTGVMIEKGLASNILTAVESAITNLPYAFLFVALALIAHGAQLESQDSKLQVVWEKLMPMHFRDDKEE